MKNFLQFVIHHSVFIALVLASVAGLEPATSAFVAQHSDFQKQISKIIRQKVGTFFSFEGNLVNFTFAF